MNINISLSTEGINAAIHKLKEVKEHLQWGLDETIDILVKEGVMIAQSADGSMASVTGYRPDDNTGIIIASGDVPAIAEFGAGDATLSARTFFENGGSLDADVFPGSYSLFVGSRDYYNFGSWRFGGVWYTEVEPRHGLFDAKLFITEKSSEIAKEVIKL